MMLSFGIIFPTGMVLGVSCPTCISFITLLITPVSADCTKSMARSSTGRRHGDCDSGILHGTLTQGSSLLEKRSLRFLQLAHVDARRTNRFRDIFEVPHYQGFPRKD